MGSGLRVQLLETSRHLVLTDHLSLSSLTCHHPNQLHRPPAPPCMPCTQSYQLHYPRHQLTRPPAHVPMPADCVCLCGPHSAAVGRGHFAQGRKGQRHRA